MNHKLTEGWKTFLLGVIVTVVLFLVTPLYPCLIDLMWGNHPDTRVIVILQGNGTSVNILLENHGDAVDRNVVITCEMHANRIHWARITGKERMAVIPSGHKRIQFKFEELLPREMQGLHIMAKKPDRVGTISAWSEKCQDIDIIYHTFTITAGIPQDVN